MYEELVNEIIEGRRLGKEDDLTFLIDGDLESDSGQNACRQRV